VKLLRIIRLLLSIGYLGLKRYTLLLGQFVASMGMLRAVFLILAVGYFLLVWSVMTLFLVAFDDTGQLQREGVMFAPLYTLYALFFTPMASVLLPILVLAMIWCAIEVYRYWRERAKERGDEDGDGGGR
jgi:hypothetical protein